MLKISPPITLTALYFIQARVYVCLKESGVQVHVEELIVINKGPFPSKLKETYKFLSWSCD
jgi:hypothetical protein